MHIKDCLRNPANLHAAMSYYRPLFDPARFGSAAEMEEQIAAWGRPLLQPTLYLHGTQDSCVGLDAEATNSVLAFLGTGSAAERIDDAGHFLQVEKPTQINECILRFLG